MFNLYRPYRIIAVALAAAIIVCSCSDDNVSESLDMSSVPVQVIGNMNALQSENGVLQSRMAAPRMERYVKDTISYELFPEGLKVFTYTPSGALESTIEADAARHVTTSGKQQWSAFGNVVMLNHIKGDRMETDTVYWNMEEKKIYTDCYVRMQSEDGFLQGFGMESDERLSNAVILRTFDSNFRVTKDSTKVYLDSLNFIGPVLL